MTCPRCQGLMESVRMEDAGNLTSRHVSGWHCLLCGEVIEAGIEANRIGYHEPTRDRTRPRYLGGPTDLKTARKKDVPT
jgi:hypothetical protein